MRSASTAPPMFEPSQTSSVPTIVVLVLSLVLAFTPNWEWPYEIAQVQLGLSWASAGMVQATLREILIVLGILSTVLFWEGKPLASIGVQSLRTSDLGLAVAAYLLLELSQDFIGALLNSQALRATVPAPNLAQDFLELPLYLLLVGATVNSVYEEMWRAFAIERVEKISGSVTTASIFSLIASVSTHVPYWGFRGALVLAPAQLVFVLLYVGRRSLPTCVVTHLISDVYPTAIRPALSTQGVAALSRFGL
ncbi:MAG: CPBP family glutamic-type intramembrane protease [Candidatus Binatus sp.]|uniref:CPBP family glutamic-type intramembrane protease n=1 Tax=Candidatus Binatus sp. TaxID=2811406 RepID=UPI003D097594